MQIRHGSLGQLGSAECEEVRREYLPLLIWALLRKNNSYFLLYSCNPLQEVYRPTRFSLLPSYCHALPANSQVHIGSTLGPRDPGVGMQ